MGILYHFFTLSLLIAISSWSKGLTIQNCTMLQRCFRQWLQANGRLAENTVFGAEMVQKQCSFPAHAGRKPRTKPWTGDEMRVNDWKKNGFGAQKAPTLETVRPSIA